MKLVVVTGFVKPSDPEQKVRPAVILGMVDGRVVIAPCTSNPERSGMVLRGGVLLTKASPAYAKSGLRADQVVIDIRNAASYAIDSDMVRECRQIGTIDTDTDKRFRDNLIFMLRKYDTLNVRAA